MNRYLKHVAVAVVLSAGGIAGAHNVLGLAYSGFNAGDANIDKFRASLAATGANVTWLDGAGPGSLAGFLASASFDSIFIYDISGQGGLTDGNDAAALGAWYNNKSVVLDGRSYGSYFQSVGGGSDQFLQNVSDFFGANGGGLYVGADDHPTWTSNANALLAGAGFNGFDGDESTYDTYVSASPLYAGMADPANDLAWDYSPGNWSVAQAPVGLQPNGVVLGGIYFNEDDSPLISTALVPAPGMTGLAVIAGLVAVRRRRA